MKVHHHLRWPRIAAAALSIALWQASSATAADLTELKVGQSDAANTVLALYMANAGGLYAAQGLKVDISTMGGGSKGAEELQAGRLDVMHVGLSSIIKLNQEGGDLRLIASLANAVRFVMFAAPGVNSAADLKGGVLAVSTFGSESDTTATIALERLGLKRSDVVLKEFGTNPARLAAIKSGQAKATMLAEPGTTQAREEGLKPLADMVSDRVPWIFSALNVRHRDLDGRRDVFKRFLKATAEGAYLGLSNETLAKQVLAKEVKITDPKLLDIAYAEYKRETPLTLDPIKPGADAILAQFPGVSHKVEDYIDRSLLDELIREGFFAEMQRKYALT